MNLERDDIMLAYHIQSILNKHSGLSINSIEQFLKEEGVLCSKKEISMALSYLLFEIGCVCRDDYWSKAPIYQYIDEPSLHDSGYSKHYYSFSVDDDSLDKCFLLISDTHIGNPQLEDFHLLDRIYDYSIGKGATKCFHLGDLFAGGMSEEQLLSQIESFISFYPNPDEKEMTTYGLIGNHDESVHGFFNPLQGIKSKRFLDLRGLNAFIPSFYILPRPKWNAEFSDTSFHFSHRLYISWIRPMVRMLELEDFKEEQKWFSDQYDVLISGHLHHGLIYTTDIPLVPGKEQIFLGVPSTSQFNLGESVGYLVSLHYEKPGVVQKMNVSFLHSDFDHHIFEDGEVVWSFKEKNKCYQKIL